MSKNTQCLMQEKGTMDVNPLEMSKNSVDTSKLSMKPVKAIKKTKMISK